MSASSSASLCHRILRRAGPIRRWPTRAAPTSRLVARAPHPTIARRNPSLPLAGFGGFDVRGLSSSAEAPEEEDEHEEPVPRRRFEDLGLHPKSLKALRRHGFHNLTEIQEKTFDPVVSGRDVVGRARTGTGKTLSFLLPSLERIVRQQQQQQQDGDEEDLGARSPADGIRMLILSPTRELAAQIAKEAERLAAQHGPDITSQVVYGGSSKRDDIDRFHRQLPTILVATPGRLKDHLASTQLNGHRPFIDVLQDLQILVLDETDRLLDMGFRRDITDILSCLPRRKRQTLLFSATLPDSVREVVDLAIKRNDHDMVDCIRDEDPASHTNAKTEQSHIVLLADRFWTGSMEYLLDLVDQNDKKIMVFFPMTSMVQLYARIFNTRFGRRVWELHGKMHQRERTTVSRRFRNARKGVLFTSDVSARGVDYPNVTHVVQIGASESRETYIHRLGRTGRAGKKGVGMLILPEVEKDFLGELAGLDLDRDETSQSQFVTKAPSKKLMDELGPMAQDVRSGRDAKLEKCAHDAYQAMISYYFQRCDKDQARDVVATVNRLVQDMGLKELPAIELQRAKRIGLDGLPGLNIQTHWKDQSWMGDWTEGGPAPHDPTRFGKPYGDFDGRFGSDPQYSQSRRGDGGRRRGSPEGTKRGRRSNQNHGRPDPSWDSPRGYGSGRSRSKSSEPRRGSGSRRFDEAFTKLGWKYHDSVSNRQDSNNRRMSGTKKKKHGAFQRWEAPGEFSFRK